MSRKILLPSSRVPGQLTGNFRGGDARRGVISEWPTGCVLEGLEWCWAEFDVGAKSQSRLTLTSVPSGAPRNLAECLGELEITSHLGKKTFFRPQSPVPV